MEPVQAETIFVLPDIGGYTRFMVHNKKAPERAQKIIRELMEAMLHEVNIPLHISEIEGDALFMYAHKEDGQDWEKEKREIAQTLEHFFLAFYGKMKTLLESNVCTCEDCTDVTNLRIKIVMHKGMAVIDHIDRFTTINGVEAIAVHRLLKNSLRGDYLLVTKEAFEGCPFPSPERFKPHQEHYDDIGTIEAFVYHFNTHGVRPEATMQEEQAA